MQRAALLLVPLLLPVLAAPPSAPRPQIVLQQGHTGVIHALAVTHDGRTLASGGQDGAARLWSLPNGRLARVLAAPGMGRIRALSFSPDGRLLAAGFENTRDNTGAVLVWDARTGALLRRMPGLDRRVSHGVFSLAFSPDGRFLAACGQEHFTRMWNARTGALAWSYEVNGGANTLAFSPDGRTVAVGHWDDRIRLLDARTGKPRRILEGIRPFIWALAFSPDGRVLAGAGGTNQGPAENGVIKLWDARTGALLRTLPGHPRETTALAFSTRTGVLFSAGFDGQVRVWSPTIGEELRAMRGLRGPLALPADGRTLACLTSRPNTTPTFAIVDARSGRILHSFSSPPPPPGLLTLSPDGARLVIGGTPRAAILLDVREGTAQALVPPDGTRPRALVFSPDSRTVAAACGMEDGSRGVVALWEARTGTLRRALPGSGEAAYALAYSPDGRLLAAVTLNDWINQNQVPPVGTVGVWDARTGAPLWRQALTRETFLSVAFSPDGREVAACGMNTPPYDPRPGAPSYLPVMKRWDARTGAPRRAYETSDENLWYSVVAFLPGGRIAGGFGSYDGHPLPVAGQLRDATTGVIQQRLAGSVRGMACAAVSPDGRRLAGADTIGRVQVWDTQTGKPLRAWTGHAGGVSGIAFTRSGRILATAGRDGTVRFWDAATGTLRLTLRALLSPGMEEAGSADWLAAAPDGRYEGSAGADAFIRWRVGSRMYPASTYARAMRRPGLLRSIVRGDMPSGRPRDSRPPRP